MLCDCALFAFFAGENMPLFQAEMPLTILLPGLQMTIAHRRVRGLSSPWRIFPTWYMDALWVEERL